MKRVISLLLTLVLALSCLPAAFAASFTDTEGHWASSYIEYMVSKKVLDGYGDGTFLPEGQVTRAEFIKMLNETFGLTATTSITYTDVAETDWFYPHIVKAAAQGYLLNYGDRFINPNGKLSRQEAAALIARYLDLDPNQKVATSTYPDYTSIGQNYRDYVLQATYAGLFEGDAESGNFSPNRILKRGEALTILYRAAGSVYRTSTTGLETAANGKNAVISNSGVTVSGADIKGRLLITEGVSNGTVTLNACNVEELVVRGTASVILSGCSVGSIVVDAPVGYTESISLSGNSTVLSFTAKSPIDVKLEAGTSVSAMTVESTAKNSTVGGAGTLTSVTVNASGFVSEKMPSKYTLATGITATLAGGVYNTSGTGTTTSTGFAVTPSTYATTASCYLKAQPTVSGALFYYFTNISTVPTAATFTTLYSAATEKSYLQVTANTPIDKLIGTTASVSAYSHIAIMIEGYQPVVIANQSSGGFVSVPTVSTNAGYERLTYTTTVSGTLYYYYTADANTPSTVTFMNTHSASTTLYKGTLTATANTALTQNTALAVDVTALPYIAVCLVDAQGNTYQPILVGKTGSAGTTVTGTGFITDPVCEYKSGLISLALIPSVSGTVEYYFTTSATVPTAEQFTQYKAVASTLYTGSISVTQNTPYSESAFTTADTVATYPYVVLRLTSSVGTKYQPVVITLPKTESVDITGSGFTTVPTTSMTSGYFYIHAQTAAAGQLYYYLTENPSAPPSEAIFRMNYEASVTATNLTSANGGVLSLTYGNQLQTVRTNITNEDGRTFGYLALMFKPNNGQNGTPITIPLVGGTDSNYNETSTGFLVSPTYTTTSSMLGYNLSFTTSVSGTVWFYFTDTATVPTSTAVKQNVQIEMVNNPTYAGAINAIGNYPTQYSNGLGLVTPAYIVLMLEDANGTLYLPVVIPTGTSASTTTTTGFVSLPSATYASGFTTLSYNASAGGTLYYYFSDTATLPTTSDAFFAQYITNVSSGAGTLTIAGAGQGTQTITAVTSRLYLIMMMQSNGTNYTPFVVTLNGSTGSIGGISGNSGFLGTPTVASGILSYYAITTGTLNIAFSTNATVTTTPTAMFTATISAAGSGTVNLAEKISPQSPIYGQMLLSAFPYAVVWITNGLTSTTPVVIAMDGSSSGGGLSSLTGNGFSTQPALFSLGTVKYVTYTPSVTGTVKYFFTNATMQYNTATAFQTAYAIESTAGMQTATAGTQGSISVTLNPINQTPLYMYMWIMIDAYTPVCVYLY